MDDIAQWLRDTAGRLINGDVEDGAIETAKLVQAADHMDRLHACQAMEAYWKKQYDLTRAHLERVRAALSDTNGVRTPE